MRSGLHLDLGVAAVVAAVGHIQPAHLAKGPVGLALDLVPAADPAALAGLELRGSTDSAFEQGNAPLQLGHLVRRGDHALPLHQFLQAVQKVECHG